MKHILTAATLLSLAAPAKAQLVNNGSNIVIGNGAQVTSGVELRNQTGGTLKNNGNMSVTANVTNAGAVKGNGSLSFTGSMANTGTVSPGNDNVGQMNITGSYNNGTGTLAIEVGGPVAGTGFDQVAVTGAVTIGGTLNVSIVNAYAPATSITFDIITGTTVTGTFSTLNLPSGWNVNYLGNKVQLQSPAPLPVVFDYFTGRKNGAANRLDWQVNSDAAGRLSLRLERSKDGQRFETIYTTQADAARCKEPFSYDDRQPLPGWSFYRLHVQEDEGKTSISKIIALNTGDAMQDKVVLAPNPIGADGQAFLQLTLKKAGKLSILVTDISGRKITEQHLDGAEGLNNIALKGISGMSAGVYQASVFTEEGNVRSVKFSKR